MSLSEHNSNDSDQEAKEMKWFLTKLENRYIADDSAEETLVERITQAYDEDMSKTEGGGVVELGRPAPSFFSLFRVGFAVAALVLISISLKSFPSMTSNLVAVDMDGGAYRSGGGDDDHLNQYSQADIESVAATFESQLNQELAKTQRQPGWAHLFKGPQQWELHALFSELRAGKINLTLRINDKDDPERLVEMDLFYPSLEACQTDGAAIVKQIAKQLDEI